jgi:O-antigen/teichoic acid export membrane protein
VVAILYDDRYEAAGWMLQALAVRVAMSCVLTPCETCLFSQGHTRWGFYQNIARSVWILIGIPLCFHYWGLAGVVWVTALSEIPVLLTLWPAFHRLGLLDGKREALAVAFFFGGFGVGLLIDQLFARFVGSI